jgi:hypothetical protein
MKTAHLRMGGNRSRVIAILTLSIYAMSGLAVTSLRCGALNDYLADDQCQKLEDLTHNKAYCMGDPGSQIGWLEINPNQYPPSLTEMRDFMQACDTFNRSIKEVKTKTYDQAKPAITCPGGAYYVCRYAQCEKAFGSGTKTCVIQSGSAQGTASGSTLICYGTTPDGQSFLQCDTPQ